MKAYEVKYRNPGCAWEYSAIIRAADDEAALELAVQDYPTATEITAL